MVGKDLNRPDPMTQQVDGSIFSLSQKYLTFIYMYLNMYLIFSRQATHILAVFICSIFRTIIVCAPGIFSS